jgi:transitional endoplasmic reticulum ATPase
LDLQLKVDLPNSSSRLAILQVHNQERPLQDVDLGSWAEATEGWNGADLALLSNQAAVMAIRRYRHQGMTVPADIRITMDDFNHAYQVLVEQRAT